MKDFFVPQIFLAWDIKYFNKWALLELFLFHLKIIFEIGKGRMVGPCEILEGFFNFSEVTLR